MVVATVAEEETVAATVAEDTVEEEETVAVEAAAAEGVVVGVGVAMVEEEAAEKTNRDSSCECREEKKRLL